MAIVPYVFRKPAQEATSAPDVVVCIPTFRRAPQLARLLRALQSQRGATRFAILVANNDDRMLDTYPDLVHPSLPTFHVIDVGTRGVSAVRNAMIADVLERYGAVRWIACLDDDQVPDPAWLSALLAAGIRYDADLVGGPVRRTSSTETFWSHGAADTSYLPTRSGPTTILNEAGNLLLATGFLRRLERPPFSLDFGRTGGEDYEFFLYALSVGARLAWANDACVSEPLPSERLTFRNYVSRFYDTAAYQARADRAYHGAGVVLRRVAWEIVKAPLLLVRSLVRDRSVRRAVGIVVRCAAIVAGRVAGLMGARSHRYGGARVESVVE